ncbi:MAG: hypothetical protein PVF77_09890 [Anaerolineae bacterium]|jgi:hypothetical protein
MVSRLEEAFCADAMHSQWDIPALINEARVHERFPLINLGAWNDDPIVIQAIKEKIDTKREGPPESQ